MDDPFDANHHVTSSLNPIAAMTQGPAGILLLSFFAYTTYFICTTLPFHGACCHEKAPIDDEDIGTYYEVVKDEDR